MPETYQPTFDIEKHFPELKSKGTVLLHPRRVPDYDEDLPVSASKMGGLFYWPVNESWPRCPIDGNPMVAVLQVTRRDVPELMFPGDTSLFQFFWCPTSYHKDTNYGPYGKVYWRKTEEDLDDDTVKNFLLQKKDIPKLSDGSDANLIPRQCMLFPERVKEFPSHIEFSALQKEQNLIYKLNKFIYLNSDKDTEHFDLIETQNTYQNSWSLSPSTKISGYVCWIDSVDYPTCDVCKKAMEHLFSISSLGGYGPDCSTRWHPIDQSFEEWTNGDGIILNGGGTFYAFICRFCPEWPIRFTTQR